MNVPATIRDALEAVMQQAEEDLKSAHEEICKLQGLDPAKHTWPEWSSPANTLRWFEEIRQRFPATEQRETVTDARDGVFVPQYALDWLFGKGPDANGQWFGDVTGAGAFWWRKQFQAMLEAAFVSEAKPVAPGSEPSSALAEADLTAPNYGGTCPRHRL